MTDPLRQKANEALTKWMEPNPIRLGTEDRWELFIQGYLAACRDLEFTLHPVEPRPLDPELLKQTFELLAKQQKGNP